MANNQNLMSIELVNARKTREERQESARNAGKKSGEVKRQRKAMKEQMEMLLSLPVVNEECIENFKKLGIDTSNMDNQLMLLVSVFNKAVKGDLEAFREIKGIVNDMSSSSINRIKIVDDLNGEND